MTWRALLKTQDGRVGAILLALLVALSFLGAPFYADPNLSDFSIPAAADGGPPTPSLRHWLGTDAIYRDELARLGAGGRISLFVAAAATAIASTIGVLIGVLSAVLGKLGFERTSAGMIRAIDVLLAFPFLLLVTLVGVLIGRTDPLTMVLVLGFTGWTGIARIIRERSLTLVEQDFVLAARAAGAGPLRIGLRHVLPNVMMTAVTLATSLAGSMILAEAVLSYLTVGLSPPDASWGRMLHEAEPYVLVRPALVALPAACIVLVVLGFHRLGEGLRQVTAADKSRALVRVPFPLDVALVGAGLALVVLLPRAELAPPAPPIAEVPPPTRGGTLRIATQYSARTLEPAIATDELGIAVSRLVFDKLLAFDEEGRFVPHLATAIAWQDEGKTLRLELRQNVRFHDGSPFGSADVKRSIERAFGPGVPSATASHFAGIAGFEAFRAGKAEHIDGIETAGDGAVLFRLVEPDSTLPSLLSMSSVVPVCPSSAKDPKAAKDAELCGAGPFKIALFEAEQRIVLTRNDAYYEPGLPYLDGIEIDQRVRPQVQRYRFERGELDLVREILGSDAALFKGDARYAAMLRVVKNLRMSAIFMNTERPPFDDPWLRRAVSLAVDPSVLERLRPDILAVGTVIPPGTPGRPDDPPARRHDLAQALEAMKTAGYPYDPATGEGGYPEPIEYVVIPGTLEQSAAEIYQQQLAKIGLRLELRLLANNSYFPTIQTRGAATMGWAGWQADYPDPLTFFDPNLVSSAIGDVTQNYSVFSDAELDRVIAEARRATDPQARKALFAKAEGIVRDRAPWIPTISPSTIEVRQPWLFGYEPDALTQLDFTRTYLALEGTGRP